MPKASETVSAGTLARLEGELASYESLLVAFSGGVDSTFLLRVAADVLGDRCVALTTLSPSTPTHDRDAALELGRAIGARHVVVDTNELEDPSYAANPVDRCFFCKQNLFVICERERRRLGLAAIADGANLDDLGDHRPGLDAAGKHGIRHPLVDAGFTKTDVRTASRTLGLPTWDRPASPCLASRIPYGTAISVEALARIDAAEQLVRALGIDVVRVRAHDTLARIEVPTDAIATLAEAMHREHLVTAFRALGYTHVAVDLAGFRSGSLNEGIVPRTHGGPGRSARARRSH